jgi:hypothetical protein
MGGNTSVFKIYHDGETQKFVKIKNAKDFDLNTFAFQSQISKQFNGRLKINKPIVHFHGVWNIKFLPYFLFVFTNRVTQDVVKFVATNTSLTLRYDKFSLVTNSRFNGAEEGFWTYNVYEQASSTNTNISGLNNVENGYMYLHPSTTFAPTEYNEQSNIFKAYNGQL